VQRARLEEIRDNVLARIAEAQREGWLGEVEGLQVSLAGAQDKLAQLDRRARNCITVELGIPTVPGKPSQLGPLSSESRAGHDPAGHPIFGLSSRRPS
jgi:hypothetical protein